MFSKPSSNTPQPATPATPQPSQTTSPTPPAAPMAAGPQTEAARVAARASKGASLIAADMTLEGDISGGGEIQIDGMIRGDVKVEHVMVGDSGTVEGGIYAEAVEVRGKVAGSITAKQVRLYGACHVDGDITHEQLAMETGAFFQGRSLRLQRPIAAASPSPSLSAPKPEPLPAPREPTSSFSAKSAPAAQA